MQLTLPEYLDLKLRHYCVVMATSNVKDRIQSEHADWNAMCHIENTDGIDLAGTFHESDVTSEAPKPGYWRLWRKADWDISNNRRVAAQQKIVDAQAAFALRKLLVIKFFTSQGIAEAIATTVVGTFTSDIIENMAKQAEGKGLTL